MRRSARSRIGRGQRRRARADHAAADDDDVEVGTHQSRLAPRASFGNPARPRQRQLRQRVLGRRHQIEREHADVAQRLDRAERLREQAHQAVGEANDVAAIGVAPLAVALEPQAVARIERIALLRASVREHLRETGCVAQTEIEALTGDRVQRLRGVADDRESLGHVLVRARQRQRIQLSRADPHEATETESERVLQAREERGVVQPGRSTARRRRANVQISPSRPSDIGSSASGPDGVKRSYATWSWKRCVRTLRHERHLVVVPGLRADAGRFAQRGLRAVGGDRQLRLDDRRCLARPRSHSIR